MVDMFYIPNLLLYTIFPFNIATPLSYFVLFLIAPFSMYILLRSLGLRKETSLISGIAFLFSAAIMLRIQHQSVANAIALFPLALKLFIDTQNKFSSKSLVLFAFVSSQILISFPQIGTYSLFVILLLGFINSTLSKSFVYKTYIFQTASIIILVLAYSALYVFPAITTVNLSERERGIQVSKILNIYPYRFENLLSFVNPFILGKSSDGSYKYKNIDQISNKGIFWENTAYIGLAHLFLGIAGMLLIIIVRSNKLFLSIALVCIITLFLALGKYAPLHFIYSFPPLNYFRVTARFILFSQVFLIIIGSYFLDKLFQKLNKKHVLILTLFTLVFMARDLLPKWWSYNPIGTIADWTKKPDILAGLDEANLKNYQMLSIGSHENWNNIFINSGWENNADKFLFFMNAVEPNSNVFYNASNIGSYQILPTRRQNLQSALVRSGIQIGKDEIAINETSQKALDVYSIKYLVSAKPLKESNLQLLNKVGYNNYTFYLYENESVKEKFSLYYDYQTVEHLSDFLKTFSDTDIERKLLLEKSVGVAKSSDDGNGTVTVDEIEPNKVKLHVKTDINALLSFNNTYFTGWNVKVDNKKKELLKANINSMAVIIPSGEHAIEFYYFPKSFYIGLVVSLVSLLLSAYILSKSK